MLNNFEPFRILRENDVPFVIIGGHAVNLHGYARVTEDSDAVWMRTEQSEHQLHSALSKMGACYIGKEIDRSTGIEKTYPVTLPFIQTSHLMMLWTNHGFLDLFDYIPGFPTEDVRSLFATTVGDAGYLYPSLDWLKQMKKASGRTKDLLDLENLP